MEIIMADDLTYDLRCIARVKKMAGFEVRLEKWKAERDYWQERAEALEAEGEEAAAKIEELVSLGNALALRLKMVVGQEDIILRWEKAVLSK